MSTKEVATNDPHADRTTKGTTHEKLATTKFVNEEEEPDDGEDGLDNTEDTGGKESSVGSADTDGLEDSGGVVVDGVDTGAVLPEEEHTTEEESPLNLVVTSDSLEGLPESKTDGGSLVFKSVVDESNLLDNVEVVDGKVTDPAKVLKTLLSSTFSDQPTRRLVKPERSKEKKTTGDELDSEGDLPLHAARLHSSGDTVVDPETDKTTNLPSEFVDTDETTTNRGRGDLRDVDRYLMIRLASNLGRARIKGKCHDEQTYNHGRTTNTETSEDSTSIDGGKVTILSVKHDTSAEHKDSDEDPQTLLATKVVGRSVGEERTEESTSLVNGDDVGLGGSEFGSGQALEVEFRDE